VVPRDAECCAVFSGFAAKGCCIHTHAERQKNRVESADAAILKKSFKGENPQHHAHARVLLCVAVCCSVLLCVAVCCRNASTASKNGV